ncbi:MAG: ABC transporter ATP-binding protein [Bdellovibrionaceae bacterium]|nr:ABC transporter ATP-binding protein [Pseudobdellovibrionaceae bacterium]MBX3033929.1 ABC transporter ATP-binding protein [Pseudobdellovibrionaceae bacterium]
MILETRALSFSRGGRALLRDLDLRLQAGDVLRLLGPNGSGKTSLSQILSGHSRDHQGQVQRGFQRHEVFLLPQGGGRDFEIPFQLREILSEKARRHPLLKNVPLNRLWNEASGGERQKILLTRALDEGAKLIILDEPSHHLDQRSRQDLEDILGRWNEIAPQSVLILIDHVLREDPRWQSLRLGDA